MALIKCPECGKEVSDKVQNCIHCGCPIGENSDIQNQDIEVNSDENNEQNVPANQQSSSCCLTWVIIIVVIFVFGAILGSCDDYQSEESRKFEAQMHKDPSSWSKEETDRFNNFIDWMDEQN